MKKSLIVFLAAFLVSLGGGSKIAYMRARKAAPAQAAHPVAAAKDSATHAAADSSTIMAPPATAAATMSDTSADRTARQDAAATRTGMASAPVPMPQAKVEPAKAPTPPADARGAGAAIPAQKGDSSTAVRPPLIPPGTAAGAIVGGRISKIFTAMSSKDAAKVLDQMDDADIVTILSGINDRKAAEVLGLLPVTRAAGISREVLKHRVGAQ